ncbi:MAG: NAD-dependent epimerase/dehydratase family protein, partial [Alistipes sp.]|nr:NAD-dependent epimerase/dehydratase family protein [Alistipes sp.]
MTRVLIFGGTGLIGTHLTLRLLRDGHHVTCIDLREPSLSPLLDEITGHSRFRFVRHDVTMPLHIECDRIFNLASPTYLHHDPSSPYDTMRTNVMGTIRTLELARENRARRVFASSGDIYLTCNGTSSMEQHRDESFYSTLCEAKRSAEALHRAYIRQHGIDARIARIFNTYGTGASLDDGRAVMSMIAAAIDNRDIVINGDGDQIRTFCWVG